MSIAEENPNFNSKINKLEQKLDAIYSQNLKKFPNDPKKRANNFFAHMTLGIRQLLENLPTDDKEKFQTYIQQKLNLNNESQIKDFIMSFPQESKNLIKSIF